jgi:poly(beta-D-mannuronate) lyase
MMPVIVNYGIVRESFSEKQQEVIEAWIDKVVRPLDKKFGGDVDRNNHRTLADSILMLWGAVKGDDALYNIGIEGFKHVLREARPDGSLPLETRRGQRATWYMRHALASMALMAEIAARKGDDLYALRENGVGMDTIVNAFVTAVYAPVSILPDAAQNHIPGPHRDYIFQDDAYLRVRGHGRHYMAFAEMLVRHPSFASTRLEALLNKTSFRERPLIDEYIGGNATCFFWEPK